MRLIADMVAYTVEHVPKWNPINICSYHLQEAGATPVQEIAYAMANAIAVLDAVRERVAGETRSWARSSAASRSSSTPASASSRSTRSSARCACSGRSSAASATASPTSSHLRFRYGVQVNSLGLTESQPENNVQRIVLEALAVTLGRGARARAIQLPAWNEALGLPRPWDQQWSLRIQQVLAYETDLLEYPDIFEGSKVMEGLVAELLEGARAEMAVVAEHGGAVAGVDYMKARARRLPPRAASRRIEDGEQIVVGLNRFTETEPSPLTAGRRRRHPDASTPGSRPSSATRSSAGAPSATAPPPRPRWRSCGGSRPPTRTSCRRRSPRPARASRRASGRGALRDAFGEFRAPTGVGEAAAGAAVRRPGGRGARRSTA